MDMDDKKVWKKQIIKNEEIQLATINPENWISDFQKKVQTHERKIRNKR